MYLPESIKANTEAEQAVIGTMLMQPETVVPEALSRLSAEDFRTDICKDVFKVCKELYRDGKPVDLLTVLEGLGTVKREEYKPALVEFCEIAPTIRNYQAYIEAVRENARRYQAHTQTIQLIEALETGEGLEHSRDIAGDICKTLNNTDAERTVTAKDGFVEFYARKMQPRKYLRTGFLNLDRYTYIDHGDYVIIGGRPSSGKTALTLQIALHMAREYTVVYFSLETSAAKIFDRLISCYGDVSFSSIKQDNISDWGKIARLSDRFGALKLYVVEASGWNVQQLRAKAIQLQADVVFIDYLSLLRSEGKTLYERVTNISIELHTMAQQCKIAVIALSQLNREAKSSSRLDMSSLRESGQIEQDADCVLLLDCINPDKPSADRELIIAKNKEGQVGKLYYSFHGDIQKFYEVDGCCK